MTTKKKIQATITLFLGDTPNVSLYRGHVTEREFAAGMKAEGWQGAEENEISYEYWEPVSKGGWKKSQPGKKGAVAVTVCPW